jgi:ribosomal protein S18 acetylase RimI-like enzyme
MLIFKKIGAFIFQNYSCYLYENELTKRGEGEFLPAIKEFNFKIVTKPQELDELVRDGFDVSKGDAEARNMLEQGAIAALLFVNNELASTEWAAVNEKANRAINIYPLTIDFSKGEAYASIVWTSPNYRRKGLHNYVYYKLYDYLRENGVKKVKSIVATDNLPAQKVHQKMGPQEKIYGRARYLKIFGMAFWSEVPSSRQSSAGRLLDRMHALTNSGKNRTVNYD